MRGSIADFDLETDRISLSLLAADAAADAGIRDADGGWKEIWQTVAVPDGTSQIILQLLDGSGIAAFAPGREAVRLRSLRLERGEGPPAMPKPRRSE
jgi:hypothetical protein